MAGFWGVVGKAANLFQLLGLDAITLVTVGTTCFLRLRKVTEECRKLEERVQVLAVLLLSPAGCWITQQHSLEQLRHLVTSALNDAHDLVDSYNGSTLFARVWRGRSTARRLRDLRTRIDSYCGLILSVDAFLFAAQASHHPTPASNAGVPTLSTGDSTDAESTPAAATDDDHTTHTIIDIISDDE